MNSESQYIIRAFNCLRDPLFIVDAQRECSSANRAFLSFIGIEADHFDDPISCNDFWPERKSIAFELEEFASEFRAYNGESFNVKLRVKPLGEGYFLIRVIAGLAKKETLNRFHNQRLETLGMLAGGVAHDFNNILAGVLGHVTYLKTILPQKGPHIESLNAIEEGGKKASTMTQQILNFSRLETTEKPVPVNLSELASRTCILLKGAISPSYTLKCSVEPSLYVLGVEGGIAQVIVNLVINARDAIKSQEGNITVQVQKVEDRKQLEKAFTGKLLLPKPHVCLSVTDNGHGISHEILKRIFEPYFSTKKDKGTGLGLSTVDAIVRALGGCIDVESEEGVGTKISVYFPAAGESLNKADKASREGRSAALKGGSERILVVDDEFPVRNVLCLSLEHLGYKVQVAASGMEAIEKFDDGSKLDLVILDMLMPQLSGENVFFKLREINPQVRVLVISGYTSEEPVRRVLEAGRSAFIQKPFTIEELAKKVRECFEWR